MDDKYIPERLRSIEYSRNNAILQRRAVFPRDVRILPASYLQARSSTLSATGVLLVGLTWLSPSSTDLQDFEVWVRDSTGQIRFLARTKDSPVRCEVTSTTGTIITFFVRTRMRSGLLNDIDSCPSVSVLTP